tara:strand:+ start:657 stop:1274 length:618 start_codon:yes stop_codon:yes gene_type:complete
VICIIDLGIGNLGSIANMVKRFYKGEVCISSDTKDIDRSSKVILSGVGAFDFAMKKLKELQIIPALENKVLLEKAPLLGICLGMQLLTTSSEEGQEEGLNWIPGKVFSFDRLGDKTFKIPHMGWNRVKVVNDHSIVTGFDEVFRFYFVHSYFVKVENSDHQLLSCHYGQSFDAAIQKENIYGVQFHPEKSHKYGFQLFNNFLGLN